MKTSMEVDSQEFVEDAHIDESALDVEWLRQTSVTMKYAKYDADMKYTVAKLKDRLDLIRAEIDLDIRQNPKAYGLVKITEAVITAAILLEEDYQKINAELQKAIYASNMATSALRTITDRKYALENLVRLHNASYFAGPTIPRDLVKERSDFEKQRSADSKIKINRIGR